jgi:hypothetical protein
MGLHLHNGEIKVWQEKKRKAQRKKKKEEEYTGQVGKKAFGELLPFFFNIAERKKTKLSQTRLSLGE